MSADRSAAVGRGKPPFGSRFQKGESGNPRGRPKKAVSNAPYEAIFQQLIVATADDGQELEMTIEAAFIRYAFRRSMKGDLKSARHLMGAINKVKNIYGNDVDDGKLYIYMNSFLSSVNDVLLPMQMARKLYRDGPAPRILLEPWLVEAALARFGDQRLSAAEQREVWGATRTPQKVQWPSWWTEQRGTGRRRVKASLQDTEGFYPPCIVPHNER